MAVARQRLTLEEFLALPEEEPALEYEDGKVTQKVSPKGKHGGLQGALVELFNRFSGPRKLARAFPELRTTFGGTSRVPDVTVFTWTRIPRDDLGEIADDIFEPPDIAVEIASPDQRLERLMQRCRAYVAQGVNLALLVDPRSRSVWLFTPDGSERELRGEDPIDVSSVLPGFELTAQELFDTLRLD